MGDPSVPLPAAGKSSNDVESNEGESMARSAELTSVKSPQQQPVYDGISSLVTNAVNWKIKGRCTRKSGMISFDSKNRSSGTRINCDFQDESGLKIKGSAFDDHAKSLDKQISVGKNYAISKAKVQDLFGNEVKGFHNYELVLYKHSQFELLKDDNDYVAPVDHFRPLSDLDSGNVDVEASINVLAVVKSIGAMQNMEIKNKDGTIRDAAYLEAQLVDRSLQHSQIPITFWGPAAADVRRHPAGSAIKLKGVVVISREGRLSLKATGVTDVEFDPKTDDAQELLSWFGGDDDSKRRRIGE